MADQKKRLVLKVRRQDAPEKRDTRRWETFEVDRVPGMTVHHGLEQVRRNPVTKDGKRVAPPVWEASCLEEACGSCAMLVNGRVMQACSARVDDVSPKGQPITLEPMTKFPLQRDLIVDRGRMGHALRRVKAWVALDGFHATGPGPRESPAAQGERYPLSRCIGCGACLEACPEVSERGSFIGAAAINEARLKNLHPTGTHDARARTESLMGEGGVAECGKAENCVEVCPKEIPLVDSIGDMARATTKRMLFGWFLKD
jgi:succinate dehydrogenase / fumarate reductase iron-sulfur subunit